MAQVMRAPCPSCKKILRVPADWVQQPLRCKNCGRLVQFRNNSFSVIPSSSPAKSALPPEATALAPDAGEAIIRRPISGYRLKGFGLRTLLIILLLLAAVAGVYRYWPGFSSPEVTDSVPPKREAAKDPPAVQGSSPVKSIGRSSSDVFPRRMLVISVNNYLYANPVSYGEPEHNVHTLVERIARVLHVHPSQILELSDTNPPKAPANQNGKKSAADKQRLELQARPVPPTKSVMEQTIRPFLETCRPQDRILLVFAGHMVDIGEAAYLVPLEGELTVKETLIPLSWLFEQLTHCKARQKLLILDTCRFDPYHGLERPGSGPMSATLDGLLQKPPASVQVWTACISGQYSYEADGVGVFLDRLSEALATSDPKLMQEPHDPLPVETLAAKVNQSTAAEVAAHIVSSDGQKAVQTPRLTGQMAEQGAPYDKEEPLPRPLEIPTPSLASGDMARPQLVRGIIQEIDLPPIRKAADANDAPVRVEALLPFSAEALKRYRPDYRSLRHIEQDSAKYALRVQVLKTVRLLRATFNPQGPQGLLTDYFQGDSNERIKAIILREQRKPARVLAELNERLEELRKAGEQRDKETSPRWQAHYDYILAQLLARTAYLSEYDLMLGKIRKDELPELQPRLHTGWRLASREKMQSGKDVKEMAAEARKLFAKVIQEHPGTPWEVLAKREGLTALGLEWQPSR